MARKLDRPIGLTAIDLMLTSLPNAPNDLVIDHPESVYISELRYFGDEPNEQPLFGVYRLNIDGSVHLIPCRPMGSTCSSVAITTFTG